MLGCSFCGKAGKQLALAITKKLADRNIPLGIFGMSDSCAANYGKWLGSYIFIQLFMHNAVDPFDLYFRFYLGCTAFLRRIHGKKLFTQLNCGCHVCSNCIKKVFVFGCDQIIGDELEGRKMIAPHYDENSKLSAVSGLLVDHHYTVNKKVIDIHLF